MPDLQGSVYAGQEPPQYVTFPDGWDKSFDPDGWVRRVTWRVCGAHFKPGQMFGFVAHITPEMADDRKRVDDQIRRFNHLLEDVRKKNDFPVAMIEDAATDDAGAHRWVFDSSGWRMITTEDQTNAVAFN